VRLCAAPLVEGTLAATVSAASGAGIDKVIADAMNALEAKRVQLGLPSPTLTPPGAALADDGDSNRFRWSLQNHNGLHVRPASKLVAALAGFNADLLLEKTGSASNRTASTKSPCCRCAATISCACWPAGQRPMRRWRRFRRWPPITSANRLRRNRAARRLRARRIALRYPLALINRCVQPPPMSPASSSDCAGHRPDAGGSHRPDRAGG
jgi:PTS hybrid protein